MKISLFVKLIFAAVALPTIAAVVIGELFRYGVITDHGWWVTAVLWLMRVEMDPVEFAFLAGAGLYIALFAGLGGLHKVYQFGRWTTIKAFLALTLVPTFFFVLSWFIPSAAQLRGPAAVVAFEGLVVAIGLNVMLP